MIPILLWAAALGTSSSGCVEIAYLLRGAGGVPTDGGDSSDLNGNNPADGNDNGTAPSVRLTVSNTSPTAQEEVFLACTLTAGDESGVTYSFSPGDGRLVVDPQRGTASFIVAESDVNQAFTFTCTATNDAGTSAPSNSVVIIPAG